MSRKYRHQGYQDNDRDDDRDRSSSGRRSKPPTRPLTPEEKARRRGVRHALDRAANEVLRCHVCGRNANTGTVERDTKCPGCDAPLRCCRTCTHFDSAARWECRAEITEHVPNKAAPNDCALYEPRLVLDATGKRSADPKKPSSDDPRSMFDSLFKN